MIHELKTWPEPYAAILDGRKRFEVRVNDRGFAVGDELHLREWSPYPVTGGGDYTGREIRVRVTYLVPGGKWGLPDYLCAMGIAAPSPSPGEETRDEAKACAEAWQRVLSSRATTAKEAAPTRSTTTTASSPRAGARRSDMSPYEYAAIEIAEEIKRARTKHAPMRGAHEGYAVLLEEVDELWEEVKRRNPDFAAMRKEAIQIAAMGLAFAVEVCDARGGSKEDDHAR